jgi:diguanylate cyclase (GGDEF)-like protein
LAQGNRLFLLAIMVVPVMLTSVIFPARIVGLNAAWCVAYVLAITFGLELHDFLDCPPILTYPLVTIIGTAIVASRVRDLDAESRSTAVVDRLTGMLNRAALTPRLAELEHQSGVTGEQVALIVCDVDRFKSINDERGHLCGDFVLKEVVRMVSDFFRKEQVFARVGGDEFAVLTPEAKLDGAKTLGERLRSRVANHEFDYGGTTFHVTCSFGIAELSPEMKSPEELYEAADRALYAAKRGGRDKVEAFVRPAVREVG